jgi:excisionase family DNA binding protein
MTRDCEELTPWMTVKEAAKRIGASVEFVYDACSANGLKHTRLGGKRNIRIKPEHLDEWMEQFEVVNAA